MGRNNNTSHANNTPRTRQVSDLTQEEVLAGYKDKYGREKTFSDNVALHTGDKVTLKPLEWNGVESFADARDRWVQHHEPENGIGAWDGVLTTDGGEIGLAQLYRKGSGCVEADNGDARFFTLLQKCTNHKIVLQVVDEKARLVGKNWAKTRYWKIVEELPID